jgi:predicted Zn-dependent protease with MMP-like domain
LSADDAVLDRLDALADEGDLEGIEEAALAALEGAERPEDLWRYIAWARFELNRLEDALAAARAARDALLEAKSLFHLWRFDEAAQALARFRGEDEDEAEAEWYRGLLAEFRGGDAIRHYRRANKLAPDIFREPARLTDAQVDDVVRAAKAALPPAVARAVEETAIEVLPLPRPHRDVDPLSLGLYLGHDLLSRTVEDSGQMPPRIELYRKNIERIARDRDEAVDELRITLLHEIGHHVGMDEQQIEEAGFG